MTIAFYLRISQSDGDYGKDGKDESNSIDNQRMLLEAFSEKHFEPGFETKEYVDDGFSGTNFDRPAFKRLIEDAKKGRFEILLVKDLSRLGRDYIGVGDYIDQIFPVLGIRFIAVNSNYDSNRYAGKTMGLDMTVTNFINTLYSRDLSKKVKTGLLSKWKQGKCTNGSPPYGYLRDKSCRGSWRPDPEAAKVVKMIFDLAAHDWSLKMITEKLNREMIDPPAKYKRLHGRSSNTPAISEKEELWDVNKVRTILRRREYYGTQIYNRYTAIKVGQSNVRKVPESEHIVMEDAHEALISKEEYDKAQTICGSVLQPRSSLGRDDFILKGKIRCGNCRLMLYHTTNLYQQKFYCSHTKITGSYSKCCKDRYTESHVNGTVFVTLRQQLQLLSDTYEKMKEDQADTSRSYFEQKRALKKQIELKQSDRIRKYEAYADGLVSLESYKKFKESITSDIAVLKDALSSLERTHQEENSLFTELDHYCKDSEEVFHGDKLTREMVDRFVANVYVYDKWHIEVEFLFQDIMQDLIETCEKC